MAAYRTVTFNGTAGTPTSWSATSIVVPVPAGAATGNVVVTVNGVASVETSFTVLPTPVISSLTPNAAGVGVSVTIAGTNFGATQGSSTVTFHGTSAAPTSWSATSIVTLVPTGATTGNVVVTVNGVASAGVSFTVYPPPTISSITPNSATAGGADFFLTVNGGNFLSDATVKWNTTTLTTTFVNNGLLAAAVPASLIATAGTPSVTVTSVAGTSSAVSFPVTATPVISGVSPSSGVAGTQVTISGTGFGTTQGSGSLWLGTTLGNVVSWSDTQVVATVASNAASGSARVRQGPTWSNAVTFTVNTATITGVSPTSGLPGTTVTITGSGFGASQGSGQVWLGTANGVVQTWSDAQIVAQVATGSTTGNARVLQNGVWSNSLTFTVNLPHITSVSPQSGGAGTSVTITGTGFGSSQGSGIVWLGSRSGQVVSWSDTQVVAGVDASAVSGIARVQQSGVWSNSMTFTVSGGAVTTLSPSLVNLVVGDTKTLQALNSSGQTVTGLTWSSSDTTVVSLSTDDPPVLTALAAGHVTITAGGASTDVTVWSDSLPLGTTTWSVAGDFTSVLPAVPSATGVADVFGFKSDGTVQAITSDGAVAWTADASNASAKLPDFQGGLVLLQSTGTAITKVDGTTGQRYPTYTAAPGVSDNLIAVHTDGTVFAITGGTPENPTTVIGIDPTTGAEKFRVPLPAWTASQTPALGLIIAGDGYAYVPYGIREYPALCGCQLVHVWLLRVSSSGASDTIKIADLTTGPSDEPPPYTLNMITNVDTGVLLTWRLAKDQYMAITNGTSVTLVTAPVLPDQNDAVIPQLQAQDGSFVGTALVGAPGTHQTPYTVAFDAAGSLRWTIANEVPQVATFDGGLIGQSGTAYDQNGDAVGEIGTMTQSWRLNTYQVGSVNRLNAASVGAAMSFWAFLRGNPSANLAASSLFAPLTSGFTEAKAHMVTALANAKQKIQTKPACKQLFGNPNSWSVGFDPVFVLDALYSNVGTWGVPMTPNRVGGRKVASHFGYKWMVWALLPDRDAITWWVVYISAPHLGAEVSPHIWIDVAAWNEADDYDRTRIILHEMGHVYDYLIPQGSGGSMILDDHNGGSINNDNRIQVNCLP